MQFRKIDSADSGCNYAPAILTDLDWSDQQEVERGTYLSPVISEDKIFAPDGLILSLIWHDYLLLKGTVIFHTHGGLQYCIIEDGKAPEEPDLQVIIIQSFNVLHDYFNQVIRLDHPLLPILSLPSQEYVLKAVSLLKKSFL